MKEKVCLKTAFVLMSLWLCFSIGGKSASAEVPAGDTNANAATGPAIVAMDANAATGAAITTYYIGGEGASEFNNGTSSAKPFATLYQAINTINSKGPGSLYEVIVQGDTTETKPSVIGSGRAYTLSIRNISNNTYTIKRGNNLLEDMITVSKSCTLILGDQNGSENINLIIDGYNGIMGYSIICNIGTLNLYNGVSLRNNVCDFPYASAIHNLSVFNMYGGEICNNKGSTYGTIFNFDTFNMYGGKIHNNSVSGSGGGIINSGNFILYNGRISANACKGRGAGIYNKGSFSMRGGMVNDNIADLEAGGVHSTKNFEMINGDITGNSTVTGVTGGVYLVGDGANNRMTGGNICGNKGIGVSIEAGSSFTMTGGSITNNTVAGIAVSGYIKLGGTIAIHTNGTLSTNIILKNDTSKIYKLSKVISSEPIYITPPSYDIGRRVLEDSLDDPEFVQLFNLPDSTLSINCSGRIVPKVGATYYVGGDNISGTNDGLSSTSPFSSLETAVLAIGRGNGIIIVQSDMNLDEPIIVEGDVAIISNGTAHKISKNQTSFGAIVYKKNIINSMFIVSGKLILGKKDEVQLIDVDATFKKSTSNNRIMDTIYIDTNGEASLNNGVTVRGNINGAAIRNQGILNIYGGEINNNAGPYVGGIINCAHGSVFMSAGSIHDNQSDGSAINGVIYGSGAVFNQDNSSFTMTGGSIYNNYGYSCSGIYNGSNCTFSMTGGTLGDNTTSHYADGIFNDTGANFIIGQDANILPDEGIWAIEGSTISVNSSLTTPDLCINITSSKLNTTTNTFDETISPGTQVYVKGPGCSMSADRLTSIFQLSSSDYRINGEGKIVKTLKSGWISLPTGTEYTYTGSAITPAIQIMDGATTLQPGSDYSVSYNDNIPVGLHNITITGIGSYDGKLTASYTIKQAVATSVTTSVQDITETASKNYSINQLINLINVTSAQVLISGGSGSLPVTWELTDGTFDYHGGSYTFTGTLQDNDNIKAGGLTLTTHITVTPVEAVTPTLSDTNVSVGKNKAATAAVLGTGILPTSGSYPQEGNYDAGYPSNGTITYTINWGNQTLDTTNNTASTTFVGKVTYTNPPKWLTIPDNITVTRKVSVTGQMIIHTIDASAGANGTISPNGVQSVTDGADITFTIAPKTNYAISAVYVDGTNIGVVASYTFKNVTSNHNISATFAPVTPANPGGGGGAPGGGGSPGGGGGAPGGGGGGPIPPVLPTPTPGAEDPNTGSGKVSLIGSDAEASVTIKKDENGSLKVSFDLSGDSNNQNSRSNTQNQPQNITIPINSEQLLEQVQDANVKDVNVAITIPKDLQGSNSVLGKELITAAKEGNKNITVSISDEEGKEQYAWTFAGNSLAESDQDIEDINLTLNVETIRNSEVNELLGSQEDPGDKGLVINFSHHGDLPSQASVRVYVGNQEGVKAGDTVLLYYYNSDTNKLESLPGSEYTVDADGYVTVQILHCSDYVLLPKAADKSMVTALIDQVGITLKDKTLYLQGSKQTADYVVTLPSTLEWVSSKDDVTGGAVGAVYITFATDNPKVVTVSKRGHLIAKSAGTCTVSAKVKLYNGKTKTYKTTITVKKVKK